MRNIVLNHKHKVILHLNALSHIHWMIDELLEASEVVKDSVDLVECCKDTKDIDSTSSLPIEL